MDELLFKVNEECGVPPIPKLDFKFVEDCVIPSPPPPIFDCPPPFPPPPEPPPLCPEITGTLTVTTHVSNRIGSSCGYASSDSAAGTISVTKSTSCEFNIAVDLDIPIPQPPCPIITTKGPKVNVGYEKCLSSTSNTFTVTPIPTCDPEEPCQFELELELSVPIPEPPCPIINVKTFKVETGYSSCLATTNKFVISSSSTVPTCPDEPGTCAFDIELTLGIPIPEPKCPIINVKTFTVETGYSSCLSTTNKFVISSSSTPATCPDEPGTCAFDIELTLGIPIPEPKCPIIKINAFTVEAAYEGCLTKTNRFVISSSSTPATCPDEPGTCAFDIELELAIPIPKPLCPTLKEGTVTVTSKYEGCSLPENKFRIIKNEIPALCPGQPPQCEFEINLDLGIPIPKPPCPIFATKYNLEPLEPNQQPYLDFYVLDVSTPDPCGNDPGQCAFEFVIELGIPLPCVPTFVTKIATVENGQILITDGIWHKETDIQRNLLKPCEFEINEYLQVPQGVILEKGDISAQWTDCNASPDLYVTIDTIKSSQGVITKHILNMLLTLPRPPKYTGGSIDLGAYGSGQINVSDDCENAEITGQISLITEACSTGGGGEPPCDPTDPYGGCYQPGGPQSLRMPLVEEPKFTSPTIAEFVKELQQNKKLRAIIREIVSSND